MGAKEQRNAYLAKVKGTQEFKDYLATKAAARKTWAKKKMRKAIRSVSKDAKLKRPLNPFFSFVTDSKLKGKAGITKASEMWKSLPTTKKQTYVDRAQQAKKEYDTYIASSKGAAALAAYKSAVEQAIAPMKATTHGAKLAAQKAKAKEKAKARKEKLMVKKAALKKKLMARKAAGK